jgi:hypothetical protein
VCDLRQLTKDLVAGGWHRGGPDTAEDKQVIDAINDRDRDPTARRALIVNWLNYYKVLIFIPGDRSLAIADQIVEFADERRERLLHRDKDRIVFEFNELEKRISRVAPRTKAGKPFVLRSLTSKGLWCCFPEDVPIFDSHAANAFRVISRICRMIPAPNQPEYACFVDLWLQVFKEVEPVISQEDLSDCPYKVRVLDRLLWYLGQDSFYDKT